MKKIFKVTQRYYNHKVLSNFFTTTVTNFVHYSRPSNKTYRPRKLYFSRENVYRSIFSLYISYIMMLDDHLSSGNLRNKEPVLWRGMINQGERQSGSAAAEGNVAL